MVFQQPAKGEDVYPVRNDGKEGCWRWGKEKMLRASNSGNIDFFARVDGTFIAYEKIRTTEARGKPHRTLLADCGQTADGTKSIKKLFDDEKVFDFSKPPSLISKLIEVGAPAGEDSDADEEFIVLDFFAGSGTTGHATMLQNEIDGGRRRYILVQLPEPLDLSSKDQEVAAAYCEKLHKPLNIAELTKERLRRAGKAIKEEHPMLHGCTGFRSFSLGTSNIRKWNPDPLNLGATLFSSIEHIEPGRTSEDLLYEVLLKLGLDLCVPNVSKAIAGKSVHSIGCGVLLVCLDEQITVAEAEPLALGIVAWHREHQTTGEVTCVFRDSAFENDVAKTNLAAILEQHGIAKVRSL